MNLNTSYYNIWIPHESKTNKIDNTICFQWFSLFFIAMLFFILVHDTLTGESSVTAEYCAKYGFLASPECW